MYRVVIVMLSVVFIASCAAFKKEKEITVAPQDFIIKQNATVSTTALAAIDEHDYLVRFEQGKTALSEKEQEKLIAWLSGTAPAMIAIRGAAGAEKYRKIGAERSLGVVRFLQSNTRGVELVILDYDAKLPGGRAFIYVLPQPLVNEIRANAPILIIRTG